MNLHDHESGHVPLGKSDQANYLMFKATIHYTYPKKDICATTLYETGTDSIATRIKPSVFVGAKIP